MTKDTGPEPKFEVKIVVDINSNGVEFSDYTLHYHNLSYATMQKLQRTITEALLDLGG